MKYIFGTAGRGQFVRRGLAAASLAHCSSARTAALFCKKSLIRNLNVASGTMNPFQPTASYVFNDGAETRSRSRTLRGAHAISFSRRATPNPPIGQVYASRRSS